jgi:hypothetical protein
MFSDIYSFGSFNSNSVEFAGSATGLGYDITIEALGGDLTWDPSDGSFGIGDDEISGGWEAMLIWYSKPLSISSFELVDLFYEGLNNSRQEKGFYLYDSDLGDGLPLDGGGIFGASFNQIIGSSEGEYSIGIGDQVQGILFASLGSQSDFAVAGYTTPVPEPSTVLLLGLGMIGLAGLGRKKFKK